MRIVRFDEEVSMSIADDGSGYKLGPLVGPGSSVQAELVYLPPGGSIGPHKTDAQTLVAVVSGHGRAGGTESEVRRLLPGYGVVWEVGDACEVHSEGGLTAIRVKGELELSAMLVTREIVVSDYDPEWPERFESLCQWIWPVVEDRAVRIDHIGSTAVPGLAAKPIIDMDVVVASPDEVRPAIDALATLGYQWRGDLGVPEREALWAPPGESLPLHNLYVVVEDSRPHLDHWLLRDLLRSDDEARDRYASLKRGNADLAGDDMDIYIKSKAMLVAELLTRARAERDLPPVTYWQPVLDDDLSLS